MKKSTIILLFFALVLSSCGIFRNSTMSENEWENSEFWAENFIAEVFYGNRTKISPTIYLPKPTVWQSKRHLYGDNLLWLSRGGLHLYPEMITYYLQHPLNTRAWDNDAPILQQPQFRNVIFLDCDEFYERFETSRYGWFWFRVSKEKREQLEHRIFSRPFFVNNGEFAIVWKNDYLVEYGQTFRQSLFETHFLVLYQRVDGRWVVVSRVATWSGHR